MYINAFFNQDKVSLQLKDHWSDWSIDKLSCKTLFVRDNAKWYYGLW